MPPGTRTVGDGLLLGPPIAVVDTDTRLIPEDCSAEEDLGGRPPPPVIGVAAAAEADLGFFVPLVVDLGVFAPLAAAVVLDAVLPPAPLVGEPVAPRVGVLTPLVVSRFEDGVFVAGVRETLVTPTEPRAGDGDDADADVNLREDAAAVTDDVRLVVVVVVVVVPVAEPFNLDEDDDDEGAAVFAPVDDGDGDATDFVRIVRVPTDNGMSLPLAGITPL